MPVYHLINYFQTWDCSGAQSVSGVRVEIRNNAVCLFVPQVYLNDKRIYPAYNNSDLHFTSTDMAVTLEIPGISTEVVYRGSSINIELASCLFEGNTEGQCGELQQHVIPDPQPYMFSGVVYEKSWGERTFDVT